MAEQENASPRFSLFPIILGMLESTSDQESSERFVLLNPFTQSMVVLHGGAGILSAVLGGATTESVTGGPPPASKASIESLKIVKKEETENEEAECVVCLEKLFDKEKEEVVVKEMPCGHRYHGECIEKWLHIHGSCPMCRYNMPEEEGEGKKREEEREEGTGNDNGVWVRISFARRDEGAGDQRRSESD
ncbi:E3 ubiquitin-protein ligase RING1-like protein [Carex littledalei]|uniref:RING-type E3 ubiquitin transferase n=1 Tax=Carex littledalei TaxID=544730 RepID=A0A833QNZ2_9POAL|nr:E3 ubiquitin-protein ligase RING1-like protein [Carex littledalei]